MATEEEEAQKLLADNTDKLTQQLGELLKSRNKANVTNKTCRELATILAKMQYDDLDVVKAMRDSQYLKNQVDESGNGNAGFLLRFVFNQSEAPKGVTYTQNIQELLKAKPHLANIATLNMAHAMPEPEAVDFFDKAMTQARNNEQNPWHPLPFVDFWKAPWYPQSESHERKLEEHHKYQKDRQNIQDRSDGFLRAAQWSYIRLKHIIAGETVGLWDAYGGMSAQLEQTLRMLEIGILSGEEPMFIHDTKERKQLERLTKQGVEPDSIRSLLIRGEERALNDSLRDAAERKQARKRSQKGNNNARGRPQNQANKRPYNDSRPSTGNSPRKGTHPSYYDPRCGLFSHIIGEGADQGVHFNPFIRVYSYTWNSSTLAS